MYIKMYLKRKKRLESWIQSALLSFGSSPGRTYCLVLHIEASRFSLEHIKNTIKAGLFTEYQGQVQLHIPVETKLFMAKIGFINIL